MKFVCRHISGVVFFLVLFAILPSGNFLDQLGLPGLSGPAQAESATAGGFDGPAELPRVLIDSSLHNTPAPGKTIAVRAGEDASKAVAQASCGDTLELQSGATFGSLRLPQKNCDDSHWIVIRTSAPDSKLPPEGTRLTPCYGGVASLPGRPALNCAATENVLAKIEFSLRGSGPVVLAPGANHYRLVGLEVTRTDSSGIVYNLIGPTNGTADHIVLDRMWIHGTPQDETTRGLMLNQVRYVAVVDSYFSDFHCTAKTGACVDAQAIGGGLGIDPMGPFKIVNNFLEASGECIELGGGAAKETPTDIEIRHNHFFRPLTWMRGQPGFVGGRDGNPFIVKNLFELKNAQRVLFDGNILENSWGGFTQTGFGILLTPKNQAIGAGNVCPVCMVTDVTIRNSIISHVASGFQIGNSLSDNGGLPRDGGRYSIHDVIVDDIRPDIYNGFGAFAQIGTQIGENQVPRLHDVSIDHVTAFPPETLFILGGPIAGGHMSGLSVTNSILAGGKKPVVSTGGGPQRNCSALGAVKTPDIVLYNCFSSYSFHHNVIIDGGGGWPKGNREVKKISDVGFADYQNGVGGSLRLANSSKFKHAAADQKDIGADMDALEKATKDVL